jgi:hypothetical protein
MNVLGGFLQAFGVALLVVAGWLVTAALGVAVAGVCVFGVGYLIEHR